MTLEAPMRCSASAERLDEPMIGSVDVRRRWLLVEDRSRWGEKAVRDVLGSAFEEGAKARGLRPLLIRHREGPPETDASRRAFLVDTVTREMTFRSIGDPGELLLDELSDGPVADFGSSLDGPIFLVCTNGRRDACCALRGRALLAALDEGDDAAAWECTHLGGHRFAGNLVCLPDGIVYGRVAPADGPRLAAAYRVGRLDPAFLRGRSAWPAPAQVAEGELRLGLGLDGITDVSLRSV
ncbi:MAG TPA: sucrase ferredoxin, partial [Candidatus Limnocylindria bacterium]